MNGTAKRIYIRSNRHDDLLGTRQFMKKSFPRTMGRMKKKPGGLCHKTPPNMVAHNYETNIFETNKKRHI